MTFILDPILENDSVFILDLELSQVRLIDNANFPWVVLVPKLPDVVEITDLACSQYKILNAEVFLMAKVMQKVFKPYKLNIATIGNKVKQLHYHIVVRYDDDLCFPDPVWGAEKNKYNINAMQVCIEKVKKGLDSFSNK